jgi:hypothetical protein
MIVKELEQSNSFFFIPICIQFAYSSKFFTLYLSSGQRTEVNGKTVVEFYTSDVPDDYILLFEGFTADGHRGSTTLLFSVKNNKETMRR